MALRLSCHTQDRRIQPHSVKTYQTIPQVVITAFLPKQRVSTHKGMSPEQVSTKTIPFILSLTLQSQS